MEIDFLIVLVSVIIYASLNLRLSVYFLACFSLSLSQTAIWKLNYRDLANTLIEWGEKKKL
jgi:hypothetical protein